MIIATAGHVDHGKTSLLKHLTGVDTDRLPEEKKRGLTIDLGFAYSDALRPGETTGFVDVPGHEKFIRNMLAGVTAIDAALLVVAADDGPMPQTREHLAILDLVGVRTAIVAVTKSDLVDTEWLDEVVAETHALLQPTGLADAPVVPVSSATGAGLDRLAAAIRTLPAAEKPAGGGFRMAIDRSFIVGGAGLVVTGLAQSGTLREGDRLAVSPAGRKAIEARVRGLKVQDAPAAQARAGDRCAVNLAGPGVEKAAIGRGQWLVAPELASVARRIDIDLRLLDSEVRPLRHWTPVHVHAGTADIPGRVALLEGGELVPDGRAVTQLVLDRSVCVCRGDAVILRDQSAQRTVGGGTVLDCDGPVIDAALGRLVRDGVVERRGERIVLAGRRIELDTRDAGLWSRIEPALMSSGRPRTVWEVSEAVGMAQQDAMRFFKRAQAAGLVVQVSKSRFMTQAALAALAATAVTGLAASGRERFTVADFRDWSGLGRNLSVEMLEYFDRAGFTRRAGNDRVIRKTAAEAFAVARGET